MECPSLHSANADCGWQCDRVFGLRPIHYLRSVATGQLPILPSQSWLGNGYLLGSVDQVAFTPVDLDPSFLPQQEGNASGSGTPVQPVTAQVRQMIAQIAQSYLGSQNWLDQAGSNKCNIFVHDVIKQAGTTPPQSDKTGARYRIDYYLGLVDSPNYPAQAGDWANPSKTLGQWQTLYVPPTNSPTVTRPPDISQPGDVIAEAINYPDGATGHVGIVASVGHTISADSAVSCYAPPTPAGTITDSNYGFRPDNC
jgi:hypothetical protein